MTVSSGLRDFGANVSTYRPSERTKISCWVELASSSEIWNRIFRCNSFFSLLFQFGVHRGLFFCFDSISRARKMKIHQQKAIDDMIDTFDLIHWPVSVCRVTQCRMPRHATHWQSSILCSNCIAHRTLRKLKWKFHENRRMGKTAKFIKNRISISRNSKE